MAGLVVLAASVSTDAAAVPAFTSSAVDALPDADLTLALARLAAADDAATGAEEIADADADADGDEEVLALDDTSSRAFTHHHNHKCKKCIVVKSTTNNVPFRKYSRHVARRV